MSKSSEVLAAAVGMLEISDLERLGEANRAAVASKFDVHNTVRRFEQMLLTLAADS